MYSFHLPVFYVHLQFMSGVEVKRVSVCLSVLPSRSGERQMP